MLKSKIALAVAAATTLAACNMTVDTVDDTGALLAEVRVIHASADAPAVNAYLSMIDNSADVANLDYADSSNYISVPATAYPVNVTGLSAGGETGAVISVDSLPLEGNTRYDIIAVGSVANGTLEPVVLADSGNLTDANNVRVRVAHLAAGAPEVDVYVTAPDADLATSTPLNNNPLPFKQALDAVEVPAGEYQIRITAAGNVDAVVYNSGAVALPAGADLLVGALDNVRSGDSPVQLVAFDQGNEIDLFDTSAGADLRVVHNSVDTPAVDVVANGNYSAPLVSGLGFTEDAGYLTVPGATYNVQVGAAGFDSAEGAAINADLTLATGAEYSVVAVGRLANIEPLVLEDDQRTVATHAKLRVVHGATNAAGVDVYLTAADDQDISDDAPVLSDVPFKADSGYLPVAGGNYTLTVTPAGSKTAAIGPVQISLSNNNVYTAIARDDGDSAVALKLLDGFVQ
ncbi:DUF4397 domain-containing protein [Salinibius halmophilus]|uniref:DUF4397 domain-containing protein n=1 Tax=Salinibius halmophilus TaxID=1853216 RepID=UPI000E66D45F|nr:DUF4397 domain-containing protein [Salinibius halmophilus]